MKKIFKFAIFIFLAFACPILIYYGEQKIKDVEEVPSLIEHQYELEKSFLSDIDDYSFDNPKVILNPYEISPLSALVIFKTNDLTTPTITIKGKDELSTYEHTFTQDTIHMLPIYGLYADTENEVTISISGKEKKLTIKTDPLPENFILPTKVTANKDKLNDDLYFFTPSSSGYTAAYDVNGDVRWYLNDYFIWDINRLNNGHLLLSSNRLINNPYYMTGLVEMDLLGKIYTEYSLPGGYHHDVFEMPNNNLLVASDNFDSGTVEDYVVEIDRTTGEIVKTFDLNNILPTDAAQSENWASYDWFHNNSVWYDEKTNSITLSGRHMDAVINIDYKSGTLNWIIGDSTNWPSEYQKYFFTPKDEDFEWQWSQHAAMITPEGYVFIFDNGNNRSKNKDEYIDANDNYSRGVMYKIDTKDMTIETVWEYGKERGSDYYSPYISDVDYLEYNHYIVHSGGHSVVDGKVSNSPAGFGNTDSLNSITTELLNDEIIFEIELPTNNYRVEKMNLYSKDIYSTGMGKSIGNMGITKADGKRKLILFSKNGDNILEKYNISFTKESDRLVFTGTFTKEDKVSIILNRMSSQKNYNVIISKKPYAAMCVDLFNEDNNSDSITVTKYINDLGLHDRYEIYLKINGKIYKMNKAVTFK